MKRNTDNQFFCNLTEYLELRMTLQKDLIVNTTDMDEVKRLQGRCHELSEMLKALTRKPVEQQPTGAFN